MISVIITNYNNGALLKKAVLSVLNQSYSNFEIIVVDDASTDDSVSMIKDIKSKKIKVIFLEKNHGAGYARNVGLQNAKGEWISFVDGDDYIEQGFYQSLMNAYYKTNKDIISCAIKYSNGKILGKKEEIVDNKQLLINNFLLDANYYLNNKIIKRKCFDGYGYCLRRYIEDTPTLGYCLMHSNGVCYIPFVGYNYIINQNSLTHTITSTKQTIYTSLAQFELFEIFKEKGYNVNINPIILADRLIRMGEYKLFNWQEIEEKYLEDFNLLNKYIDKYYPEKS